MVGLPKNLMRWAWKQAAKPGWNKSKAFKAAWRKFKGRRTKRVKRARTRRRRRRRAGNPTKRRVVRRMARRRRRSTGFGPNSMMKWIRIGALVAPAFTAATSFQDNHQKLRHGIAWYTGFDIDSGVFHFSDLMKGWTPYLAAIFMTRAIPKLSNIIRRL